ncbi:MAG TPA: hypothetical protein VGZ22_09395 [Isosphaeraceae bacterium]|jgi:hypothetical protein|nr:hypothetical protein [Isosphaeraceae bacterium]
MAATSCPQDTSFSALELPPEFEDLSGLLQADLQAMVSMLTQRAHERLLLTRREYFELQQALWNGLTEVINNTVEPLSAERR